MIKFKYNDGGRSKYFKGKTGDCVVRSIAIAAEKDYKEVYNDLFKLSKESPRNGVPKKVYEPYLKKLGFKWVATMGKGTGIQVHVRQDELPEGNLILRLSGHLATVKDKVLHDTYDCSREGTRGVYGYYIKQD